METEREKKKNKVKSIRYRYLQYETMQKAKNYDLCQISSRFVSLKCSSLFVGA